MTAGDIEHDLDEVSQRQLAGILVRGDLVEEFVQRRAVEDPVQSDAGHDRSRGAVDKGVENGGQDQRSLPGRRFESSMTKEVTLECLRMFTGVQVVVAIDDLGVEGREEGTGGGRAQTRA